MARFLVGRMRSFFEIENWSKYAGMSIQSVRTASTTSSGVQKTMKIFRYTPGEDKKPRMQEFAFNKDDCGPMVLDALIKIKSEQDPSLSFRRSCREGICGSCAMNIDGKNGLACLTQIDDSQKAIEVLPLPNFYVTRDLVPDMSHFYAQYSTIQPWLQRKSPKNSEDVEFYQSIENRAKLDGLYECILCSCCTASCPSYWWNPEYYLGPAVLMQAFRWISDSRDEYALERLAQMNDTMKTYRCHGIMNCTVCCPKGLDPAAAIGKMKDLIKDHDKEDYTAIRASMVERQAKHFATSNITGA